MKPVGSAVHLRRGSVHRSLVGWLAARFGARRLRRRARSCAPWATAAEVQSTLKHVLGGALLLAVGGIALQAWVRRGDAAGAPGREAHPPVRVGADDRRRGARRLMVGLTSVGSGSLMIVALMLLYPSLETRTLVGTDLVQAIPLVGSAALGHLLFGNVEFGLAGALLLGALPGVYLGARISSRAASPLVRPALVVLLILSASKLLGADNAHAGDARRRARHAAGAIVCVGPFPDPAPSLGAVSARKRS